MATAVTRRTFVWRVRQRLRMAVLRLPRPPVQSAVQDFPAPAHAGRIRHVARAEFSRFRTALPRAKADWSELHFIDGSPIPFATPPARTLPEQGYAKFFRGRIVNPQGWPISARDSLLMDAILVHERRGHRKFSNPTRLKPPRALHGEVVNLATQFAGVNYGHTLLDGLGRIGVLQLAGYDISQADHVVIPNLKSRTIYEILSRAGVDRSRLIEPRPGDQFVCDYLVQATFPGARRAYSAAPAHFMRSLGLGDSAAPRRRLMILRKGEKRAVENYDEIAALAQEFDLELYDPRAAAFSPADFADAELVVGPHGAALSDIGFCPPGAALVEIIPDAHSYPYFATLAVSSGLRYRAIPGRSLTPKPASNLVVDPAALRHALKSVA